MSRKNNTAERYRKSARLSQSYAELSEIDYSPERKINGRVIEQLSTGAYIDKAIFAFSKYCFIKQKTYISLYPFLLPQW